MSESISFNISVDGSKLILTPTSAITNNSIYDISLNKISGTDGSTLDPTTITTMTKLTPSYASIISVLSLTEDCNIPVTDILYHIREASKFVDYVRNGIAIGSTIPFEVEQYVKYKAAHDCVLSFYIKIAADGGGKGQLGDVLFDNGTSRLKDISSLLKDLKAEIKVWEDALRGYKLEGRAKPLVALRSRQVQAPYSEYTPINKDMNRGV